MIFRLFIFIIVFAVAAFSQAEQAGPPIEPGVSQALAQWRAAHYSDVRYKLNLTLEKMSPVLKGTMEIRVNVTGPQASRLQSPQSGEITPIILDWRKIRGSEQLSTISNVSINGKPIEVRDGGAFQIDATTKPYIIEDREHLIFGDGVKTGENVIKLDFTSPILTSGSAITRYVDKEDGAEYLYSLFVPSDASTAFPVFDQPDLKARFTLEIEAPDDWKLVSNTNSSGFNMEVVQTHSFVEPKKPLKYESRISSIKHVFPETKPISTYVFAFAAGPWERVSSPQGVSSPSVSAGVKAAPSLTVGLPTPETSIYVRKSQAAKFKPHAAETFRLTREGIKYLETYFDYKFPWPKYDLVLIPEFPFGGMEHAGCTFLRESSIIFPQEPTKNDYISRANLIFHETAHQWFGDTVTMKWFDDLWLKEGFAEFMAYKTLEKVMPEYNAWKVFYERNKQAAYATDSTKGTTPIYQPIANLNSAKSAYGNIVYRKAPSFLRQAEFYLGEDKFQTAVRAFLKKHEFANAGWEDLVKELEAASGKDLKDWAMEWVKQRGTPVVTFQSKPEGFLTIQKDTLGAGNFWDEKFNIIAKYPNGNFEISTKYIESGERYSKFLQPETEAKPVLIFPNYQDYGYGIFLLDDKSRDYVLKNIGREKDDFLRTMMWGSLWDSVREAELDPKDYVELAIRNLPTEQDETIVSSILGRVSTAMNYYMSDRDASAELVSSPTVKEGTLQRSNGTAPSLTVGLRTRLEALLIDKIQHAATPGQRITYYRAFLNIASSANARDILKQILKNGSAQSVPGTVVIGASQRPAAATQAGSLRSDALPLRTKDRFDIVTRLMILGDPDAPKLLADLIKTETGDDAKRYAYAAKAGTATAANKAKFWNDFLTNKDISESWIEAAFGPFNSVKHSDLTLPYLERALAELPNLKRNRKIFFVNGWLGAFIGGQRSEAALAIVNKFLADNPNIDKDLRLKILENVDLIERAVKIRSKYR